MPVYKDNERQVSADTPPVNGNQQAMEDPNSPVAVTDGEAYDPNAPNVTHWQSPVGLPSSGGSSPERALSFSTTVIDGIIPFNYGTRKISGLCAGRKVVGNNLYVAFVLCFGEQDSVTDIKLNDEDIGGFPGLSWVTDVTIRYGAAGETIPTIYSSFGEDADWEKYCYICLTINTREAQIPGALNLSAVVGGQKCYNPWTTVTEVSSNPGVIAYDIQTNPNWKGLAASRIDHAQWEPFVNWCNENPGDGTDQWAFNGTIYNRDPDAAISEVLGHAFAAPYFSPEGKLRIWSEMDPPKITGTWTSSGVNVSEDGAAGAATTELEVGDLIYIGETNLREVATIVDDDNFTITEAHNQASKNVRRTSGVYLRAEDWVQLPSGSSIGPSSIPEVVIVRHTQEDTWGSNVYPEHTDISEDKRVEMSASGCTNASQARRTSETKQRLVEYQPFIWKAIAGPKAAVLEPGDIFFFDDDLLEMQPARVLPPVNWLIKGAYELEFREYDPNAVSRNTQANNVPPVIDPPWSTDDPDEPTAATQIFKERGDWPAISILPDPDDLQTAWTDVFLTSTYDAVNELTDCLCPAGSNGWVHYSPTYPANDPETGLVTFCYKLDAGGSAYVQYGAFPGPVPVYETLTADGEWHRKTIIFPDWDEPTITNYIEFRITNSGGIDPINLALKRVHVVEWGFRPAYGLSQTWSWNEDPSASTSVERYQLYDVDAPGIVLAEVPVGTSELDMTVLSGGLSFPGGGQLADDRSVDYFMRAVGPGGGSVVFPDPTQEFGITIYGHELPENKDVNGANKEAGGDRSVVWDEAAGEHVYQPYADFGTLLALGTGILAADRQFCTPDFDDGTRTFTLEIPSKTFTYYIRGQEYTLAIGADPTVIIPDVEDEYHIYIDTDGNLTATTSWSMATILEGNCFICSVYWDATNSEAVFMLDERHAMMEPSTHFYLHRRFSAYLESGCALGNIDSAGNGNADSHAQFSVDSGELVDEDLSHTIAAYLTSDTKRLMYLDGATPNLRRAPASSAPLYKGTNRLYFNEFSGGSWGISEIGSNGNYMWIWIAVTPDLLADQQVIGLMGQEEYSNALQARDGGPTELASLVNIMPQDEMQIVAGILYQTSSTYGNTWAARIRPDADGNDYWDLTTSEIGSGSPPSDHNALAGRSDAACHPDTAISVDSSLFGGMLTGITDVHDAIELLDRIEADDIDLSATHTGFLSGASNVSDAMIVLDDFSAGFYSGTQAFDHGSFITYRDSLLTRADIQAFYMNEDYLAIGQHLPSLAYLDEIRLWSLTNIYNNLQFGGRNAADTGTVHFVSINASDETQWGENGQDNHWYGFQKEPFYFDGDAGDAILSVAGKGSSGDVLLCDSNKNLLLNTELYFDNNDEYLYGTETGAAQRKMLGMNSSNQVQIASTSSAVSVVSSGWVYMTGSLDISAGIYFENNQHIWMKESGGTSRPVMYMTTGNDLYIGNTNTGTAILSDGTVWFNHADLTAIDTADIEHLKATNSKALSDGVNIEFARSFLQASAPAKTTVVFYYEIQATNLTGTDIQTESGFVTMTMMRNSSGTNTAITSVKSGTSNGATSGTLTCAFSSGTAGSDHQRCRVLANSSFGTPTITGQFTAIGNADAAITWS